MAPLTNNRNKYKGPGLQRGEFMRPEVFYNPVVAITWVCFRNLWTRANISTG